MRLTSVSVYNFRSIRKLENIRLESLQAFVGENDAGKSNLLRSISIFLTTGTAGVTRDDFFDPQEPIVVEAQFSNLEDGEKSKLRPYLIGDKLILRKIISCQLDLKSQKPKIGAEYHGYRAEPRDWWLSTEKIQVREGKRPNWSQIAEAHGLTQYAADADGKVTKASFESGLLRYLAENPGIEFDEPQLGQTQALGIQPNLLSALPEFYLLPAITDYSDEIDSRSTTTVFRRLMADLSDRFITSDPSYAKVQEALATIKGLLNPGNAAGTRLEALTTIEEQLHKTISKVMPTVRSVQLGVKVDEPKDIFARGVSIQIDDGVMTDVLDKGNGMQRSLVFSLLQLLMTSAKISRKGRPIILGIEEPELYIHPQSQRLIFKVIREFAGVQSDYTVTGNDQVIYTTHSPAFIDVGHYEQIGCVSKVDPANGTEFKQCDPGVLGSLDERKGFKLLTSFGLRHNELFFARYCILVEGSQDEIAVIACSRKLGKFVELPDEMHVSIIATGAKGQVPKFQRILNAFGLKYSVLLEMDGKDENDPENKVILGLLNGNLVGKIPNKLESLTTTSKGHFDDDYEAKEYFSDPHNITADLELVVKQLYPPVADAAACSS